jgi:hypothetical protein
MSEWVSTPDKDISFEHCGRPAYWEGDQVYCSKCQEMLDECVSTTCNCGVSNRKNWDYQEHEDTCPIWIQVIELYAGENE